MHFIHRLFNGINLFTICYIFQTEKPETRMSTRSSVESSSKSVGRSPFRRSARKKQPPSTHPRIHSGSLVLPTFSERLQSFIDSDRLALHANLFVQEAVDHLLTLNPYPTRAEYNLYSKALVQKYPVLKTYDEDSGKDYVGIILITGIQLK